MDGVLRVCVRGQGPRDVSPAPLLAYLAACGVERVDRPDAADAVLVLGDADTDGGTALDLDRPVLLVGAGLCGTTADAAGLLMGAVTPVHEIRVRPGPAAGDVADRMGELLLRDCWPRVEKVADDVEVLLSANVAYSDHPVATWRPSTQVGALTVGSSASSYADPSWHRIVHRLLRRLTGRADGTAVRVGLLGYGAIGHEHNAAIAATPGLELVAVCDTNPARITAARELAPGLRAHDRGDALLDDDAVDLVVVSTPPNTHADWAIRALSAGKSVLVEKPFCLTVEEADRQIAAAAERGLTLAVYQNRRWDSDFRALRALVRDGALGEVFHYESFIGGYEHPCNYWHSDATVSGGAIYDWGSHYLDWALELFPQPVEWVSATTHKRVWHDVTNADHSRVLIHFTDGVEAEFTHSDLAAARKPKFYVLGTLGGVIGDWRQETVVARSPIGTLIEDPLSPADAPARLRRFAADGSETLVAIPPSPAQPFHRELADAMLSGEPMSVTPAGSRRNIAVMQAATESAARGGRPVEPA